MRRLWHQLGPGRGGHRPGTPCRPRPRPRAAAAPADHGPPAHGLPATWPETLTPGRPTVPGQRPRSTVTPGTVDLDQRTPSERRTIVRPRVPAPLGAAPRTGPDSCSEPGVRIACGMEQPAAAAPPSVSRSWDVHWSGTSRARDCSRRPSAQRPAHAAGWRAGCSVSALGPGRRRRASRSSRPNQAQYSAVPTVYSAMIVTKFTV